MARPCAVCLSSKCSEVEKYLEFHSQADTARKFDFSRTQMQWHAAHHMMPPNEASTSNDLPAFNLLNELETLIQQNSEAIKTCRNPQEKAKLVLTQSNLFDQLTLEKKKQKDGQSWREVAYDNLTIAECDQLYRLMGKLCGDEQDINVPIDLSHALECRFRFRNLLEESPPGIKE